MSAKEILSNLKKSSTLGQVLEAVKPLLAEAHYQRIKQSFQSGVKPAIATTEEVNFISQKYWELFDEDVNRLTAMNDLRQELANFNIVDNGSLFNR